MLAAASAAPGSPASELRDPQQQAWLAEAGLAVGTPLTDAASSKTCGSYARRALSDTTAGGAGGPEAVRVWYVRGSGGHCSVLY